MKYIINLTIVFDPESHLLTLRNNPILTVSLSNPATRLLSELIRHNKTVLTRETLIKHVWEEYGFSPSNATLSNHISELRKAFEALGVSKKILITAPRIGFKIEADIHPETKAPKEPATTEPLPPHEPQPEENLAFSLIDADSKKNSIRTKVQALFLVLVLIAIVIAATCIALTTDDEQTLIGVQDKCKIYTLDDRKQDIEQFDRIRKMLVDEKIDCIQVDRDIFYMVVRPANELFKAHFMAVCTKNDNMNYKNCNNYKSIE